MGNDIFTQTCGDSYVNHAKVGAVLLVSAKIEFASHEQKTAFEASAGAKIAGLLSVAGAFSKEENSSTKGAILRISATQLGGDTTKLANLFGKPGPDGYYILTCANGATGDCNKAISQIIEYAQNDFQKSIDLTNPSTKNNYYTYGINKMTYKQIGVFATLPDLTDEAITAKEYLIKQVKQDIEIYGYLLRYIKQPFINNLEPKIIASLNKTIKDYYEINQIYYNYDIVYACYGSGDAVSKNCIKAAKTVKDLHNNYIDSIKSAHKFASAYLISGIKSFFLVGASDWNYQGYSTFTGGGRYAIQHSNLICDVDTTTDNSYAKDWYKPLTGYFFICPNENTAFDTYGKRITVKVPTEDNPKDFVIFGYWKDGTQYDYPVNEYGFNGHVLYSDETTWEYNNI